MHTIYAYMYELYAIVVIFKLCIKDNYSPNFKKFEGTPISSATVHMYSSYKK